MVKALTVKQPWASLIVAGIKTIETRPWQTAHRGPLAIHAGREHYVGAWSRPLWQATDRVSRHHGVTGYPDRWPSGAIVGTVELVDVLPITGPNEAGHLRFVCPDVYGGLTRYTFPPDGPALVEEDVNDQRKLGDFSEGRYAWLLGDAEAFDAPVPERGRQGLWEWDGSRF
ncbi:MAG: ASCH domain-containing protein [Rhodospirillales bacterium]|nr:ASCH domain-containing protein [Rhodospirillales bacterium]